MRKDLRNRYHFSGNTIWAIGSMGLVFPHIFPRLKSHILAYFRLIPRGVNCIIITTISMKLKLIIILSCAFFTVAAQDDSTLFSRIQAISNSGIDFFNVDGIEITSQNIVGGFNQKNIAKKFKKYSIKESDLFEADSTLGIPNYVVSKKEEIGAGVIQYTSYYFVGRPEGSKAVTFASVNKNDKSLERLFMRRLIDNQIPKEIYTPLKADSINFAGRAITLGGTCRWMGVGNVQCPSNGQMNWSVHKTLEDAAFSVESQYKTIQAKKQGKIISEEMVDVIFEGAAVKARRAVFDFKGVTSAIVGMSGGKTLTIYFVAAPVREHFVSCVMSFWNNDNITANGLAPLLEKVMKLQK